MNKMEKCLRCQSTNLTEDNTKYSIFIECEVCSFDQAFGCNLNSINYYPEFRNYSFVVDKYYLVWENTKISCIANRYSGKFYLKLDYWFPFDITLEKT